MYPHESRLAALASLVIVLTSACARPTKIAPEQLPSYLQPLPGAQEVAAKKSGPNAGVEYTLNVCYPADSALRSIGMRMPRSWHSRREDFLNPGIPTSQVRGWTNYYDDHNGHHEWVNRWSGQWQDNTGAVVNYDLAYRSPGVFETPQDVPSNCTMHVSAMLVSAEAVRKLQR